MGNSEKSITQAAPLRNEENDSRPDRYPYPLEPARREFLSALAGDYSVILISAVLWRNRSPWALKRRTCNDSFLLAPLKGTLRLYLDEGEETIPPGNFVMLPDGHPHAIRLIAGRQLEQVSLHFTFRNAWGEPLLGHFRKRVGRFGSEPNALRHELLGLVSLHNQDRMASQPMAEAFLKSLMARQVLAGAELVDTVARHDARIVQALASIHRQIHRAELSVESLAMAVDLSEQRFRALFRKELGESPRRFIHQLRLRQVAARLRGSSDSIRRIALDTGFANAQYLHKVFREAYGCSPTQYRRQVHDRP